MCTWQQALAAHRTPWSRSRCPIGNEEFRDNLSALWSAASGPCCRMPALWSAVRAACPGISGQWIRQIRSCLGTPDATAAAIPALTAVAAAAIVSSASACATGFLHARSGERRGAARMAPPGISRISTADTAPARSGSKSLQPAAHLSRGVSTNESADNARLWWRFRAGSRRGATGCLARCQRVSAAGKRGKLSGATVWRHVRQLAPRSQCAALLAQRAAGARPFRRIARRRWAARAIAGG